ncbi:transmembrane amino acid transporter protein-domain-containing protein [Phycomyces nitens]|nr:transmembrane amino acid transporter protein-domain-containing protein [Phycomyces nitens]
MSLDQKEKPSLNSNSDSLPHKFETTIEHREDYNPSECEKSVRSGRIEHATEATNSQVKTLFMILKSFVGTGIIFLPGAFVSGGLVFSICMLIFIGVVNLIATHLLVITQRKIGGSYGDVGRVLYGPWLRYAALFFICLTQMGFVASYMIFVSQNIGAVIDILTECAAPFDSNYIIWMAILVIVPTTWLRKIGRFSWFAILADVFILFGVVVAIYSSADKIAADGVGPNITLINSNSFALMIGTAVFAFEGVGMIVPVVEGMKRPERFPFVLNVAMAIITAFFVLTGTIGYLAFGDQTKANVVSNIPQSPLSMTVQIVYACAMMLSSPFMLYPAILIIDKGIFGERSGRDSLKWKWLKNLARSMIPIVCGAVSFGVGADSLDKFVSLVGSVACMPLCFIFPAMFHYKVTTKTWAKIGNVILGLFGAGILVYTMYVNINSWVHPTGAKAPPMCPA